MRIGISNRGTRFLTKEEARDINHKFNNLVLDDISDKTQATFKVNGSSGVYGIDFSNKEISHCVITKIIESSVINKDHELAIDPELRFQALSPVQSPLNSPTHAGPSGLRTPPKQRQEDRDSGYDSNSPPKPKDSGAHSPSGGPRSSFKEIQEPQSCFPRQVHHHLGAAEVGAAQNVQGACGRSLAPLAKPEDTRGDLESNDECSKAKPQKSESPKKQGMFERFRRHLSIRRSKSSYAIGKTTKDILQLDEEMFSSFSSGMQEILSLPLSLNMMRCLFPVLSTEEQQKRLISYACSKKVKTNPKEIEQLFSSLLPEEQEICSLLFFPEKEKRMYVDLSPSAKEQMDLFWKALGVQEITSSKDSGISSGSSSQKSTSDDEDELEASDGFSQSGRSSVSSNSSLPLLELKWILLSPSNYLQKKKKFLYKRFALLLATQVFY